MSPDRSDQQQAFAEANQLGFPLLSDPNKMVARQFGVARFGPLPIKRVTYVVGADRRVKAVLKSETDMNSHANKALEALRAL